MVTLGVTSTNQRVNEVLRNLNIVIKSNNISDNSSNMTNIMILKYADKFKRTGIASKIIQVINDLLLLLLKKLLIKFSVYSSDLYLRE